MNEDYNLFSGTVMNGTLGNINQTVQLLDCDFVLKLCYVLCQGYLTENRKTFAHFVFKELPERVF